MGQTPQKTKPEIYWLSFLCDGCSFTRYNFFIEVSNDLSRIRKVGQAPAWSVSLDKKLTRFLGDDSEAFKKGKICESQGYGIAAYAYYRRVIEKCIDSILQSLRLSLEGPAASQDLLDKLDEAMSGTVMIDRIKIAKDCVPSHLRPANMNPLSIIYDSLSIGIHRLSDNECLEQAQSIRIALGYLVKTLSEQNEEKKEFVEALRALNRFTS